MRTKVLALLSLLAVFPLSAAHFEKNVGQAPPDVQFIGRAGLSTLSVRGVSIELGAVQMTLNGAQPGEARAADPSGAVSNYLLGRDHSQWRRGVEHFRRIEWPQVYGGIDLVLRADGEELEYDFVVQPGGDPRSIRMAFEGAAAISVDESGDLVLCTVSGEVRHRRPVMYQASSTVDGRYAIRSDGTVGFDIGEYDRTATLVIDPVLFRAERFGLDTLYTDAAATDSAGNLYIVGSVEEQAPVSLGSGGGTDIVVTKFNASRQLVFTTYLGGSAYDRMHSVAIDPFGRVYAAGETLSLNFPVSEETQASNAGGKDAVVFALEPDGASFYFSTYFGSTGSDEAAGIALDGYRNAYVVGSTSGADFPSSTPLSGPSDCFLIKFDAFGRYAFSRLFGGTGYDNALAIAVDTSGLHISGATWSTDFPVTFTAEQKTLSGGADAFIARLRSNGTIAWATYWGGSAEDKAEAIAVDPEGTVYVTGHTKSTDFQTRRSTTTAGGLYDAFVMRILRGNHVAYARLIAGPGNDVGMSVTADGAGCAYVAGITASGNQFDLKDALFPTSSGIDVFLAKYAPDGTTIYSTTYGGTSSDNGSRVARTATETILVGCTSSPEIPLLPNIVPQPAMGGFVVRIQDGPAHVVPGGFSAVASSFNVIAGWDAVPGASGYYVQRRNDDRETFTYGPISQTWLVNGSVTPGEAYLYRVATAEAFAAGGPFSAWDLATVFAPTDDPVEAGVTTVKAAHLNEIRAALESARWLASLEPSLLRDVARGALVRAGDVSEAQLAINDLRLALLMPSRAFRTLAPGSPILAEDINELRDALR